MNPVTTLQEAFATRNTSAPWTPSVHTSEIERTLIGEMERRNLQSKIDSTDKPRGASLGVIPVTAVMGLDIRESDP